MEESQNEGLVREPPCQAGKDSAGREGWNDAGIVQELQMARLQQILPDEIEVRGLTNMPTEAKIEPCIGRDGLIEKLADTVDRSVELDPMRKIELRAKLELIAGIVARGEERGGVLAARIELENLTQE